MWISPPISWTKQLAGRKGVFEVEVVEVKEKILPPIDDAFAKKYDAENLAKLREGVHRDLENELKHSQAKAVRRPDHPRAAHRHEF